MLCKVCHRDLPQDRFYCTGHYSITGEPRLKNTCKPCENQQNIMVKRLRRKHPRETDKCAICNRKTKLLLDHCHVSGVFRGFLCTPCNTGIALLGDNKEGVERALRYLSQRSAVNSGPDLQG